MKNDLPKTFGSILKELREQKGLSQQALADYSEVDRAYISKLERGISAPSIITIFKLAEILKIRPFEIIQRMEKNIKK